MPEESFQRRKVLAGDGAALALYRYVPSGGGVGQPAILLVPDLGYAREIYDFQGRGLARHLQGGGRDVFVVELRGQGRSSTPASWSLADWVERDLPAAVKAVQAAHPGKVDLVVQGFGGALVIAATSQELAGRVNRVIAFNAAVQPELPNAIMGRLLAQGGAFSQLAQGAEGQRAFELLFTHQGEFPAGTAAEFRGLGLHDLSPRAAAELLGLMQGKPLRFSDGSTFADRIRRYDRPTLLLLALLDNYSHPEHASPLRTLAPAAKVSHVTLSRFDLLSEDYTHLSSLLGEHVEEEIFPRIDGFLDSAVAPAATAGGEVR